MTRHQRDARSTECGGASTVDVVQERRRTAVDDPLHATAPRD